VRVAATPQAVYHLITDVGRLQEPDAAIEAVVTRSLSALASAVANL
jgi:hypothetical protein